MYILAHNVTNMNNTVIVHNSIRKIIIELLNVYSYCIAKIEGLDVYITTYINFVI